MPKSKPKQPAVSPTPEPASSFAEDMERAGCNPPSLRPDPLWKGPESNDPQGGITQSLLCNFLVCRERFRLKTIEGIGSPDSWNHRIGYGNMWHVCEEALASKPLPGAEGTKPERLWAEALLLHGNQTIRQHPQQQEQINHWYRVCKAQFPIYVDYWKSHPDVVNRKPFMSEQAFFVNYILPSGRVVYLRGKWDSVDIVDGRAILQENKTKGDWSELFIQKQLTFDIQTMLYLVALQCHFGQHKVKYPIRGVRYNCVRRPLSGGKHSIKQKEGTSKTPAETKDQYYARLQGLIREEPAYYFARWDVPVSNKDITEFCRTFLDPVLEQLCDWYNWVTLCKRKDMDPFAAASTTKLHWRMPFGVYSPLLDGGATDLDDHLATGSMVGLAPIATLFPELE